MASLLDPIAPPAPRGPLTVVDQLLRDRAAVLERIRTGGDLLGFARAMLLTIAAGGAAFGAAIGSYRGGLQIAYAATSCRWCSS
jgi:hypothetical protein